MGQHDTWERILNSLHAAAFDEAHWEPTSALIDDVCGSQGSLLALGHPDASGGVLFARLCYRGERHQEWERKYYRRYQLVDEHLPRLTYRVSNLAVQGVPSICVQKK